MSCIVPAGLGHRWTIYPGYTACCSPAIYYQNIHAQIQNNVGTGATTPAGVNVHTYTGSLTMMPQWFYIGCWVNSTTSSTTTLIARGALASVTATSTSTGVADANAGTTAQKNVTIYYGCTGNYYLYDMKIYNSIPNALDLNAEMYAGRNTFNSPGYVIVHFTDLANTIQGYYYNYDFFPFSTLSTGTPTGAIYMTPYTLTTFSTTTNYWVYNDGADDVPFPGTMVNSYPYAQFQTIPIFGALSNTDLWTVEAWVSSAKFSTLGTYVVFGIGDQDFYFQAAYKVLAGPAYYYGLSDVIAGAVVHDVNAVTITPSDVYWHYLLMTFNDTSSSSLNNIQLAIEGTTATTVQFYTTAFAGYASNKLNYLWAGGNPFENVTTCHPLLRVKNLRLWRGAFNYMKMKGATVKGYQPYWKIPEIVDSFDFSKDFDILVESSRMRYYSPYKVRSTLYYGSQATPYYKAASYYEPGIPSLSAIGLATTISTVDFNACPPGHNRRDTRCYPDEPAMSSQSLDLRGNQATLPLSRRETSVDWTLEFWLKVRAMTSASTSILKQKTLDTSGLAIKRQNSDTVLLVYYMQAGLITVSASCGFSLYTWMHIELQNSKVNNRFYVYVDTLECTTTSVTATTRINPDYDFILGDADTEMKAKEFKLWNTYKPKVDLNYYKFSYERYRCDKAA